MSTEYPVREAGSAAAVPVSVAAAIETEPCRLEEVSGLTGPPPARPLNQKEGETPEQPPQLASPAPAAAAFGPGSRGLTGRVGPGEDPWDEQLRGPQPGSGSMPVVSPGPDPGCPPVPTPMTAATIRSHSPGAVERSDSGQGETENSPAGTLDYEGSQEQSRPQPAVSRLDPTMGPGQQPGDELLPAHGPANLAGASQTQPDLGGPEPGRCPTSNSSPAVAVEAGGAAGQLLLSSSITLVLQLFPFDGQPTDPPGGQPERRVGLLSIKNDDDTPLFAASLRGQELQEVLAHVLAPEPVAGLLDRLRQVLPERLRARQEQETRRAASAPAATSHSTAKSHTVKPGDKAKPGTPKSVAGPAPSATGTRTLAASGPGATVTQPSQAPAGASPGREIAPEKAASTAGDTNIPPGQPGSEAGGAGTGGRVLLSEIALATASAPAAEGEARPQDNRPLTQLSLF